MNSHSVAQELNIAQWVANAIAGCREPNSECIKQWDFDYPSVDLARSLQAVGNGWYFRQSNGLEQGGLGIALQWKWTELQGLEEMDSARKALLAKGLAADTVIAGGFAFGPSVGEERLWSSFGYTQWMLPALSITQSSSGTHIRVTLAAHYGDNPDVVTQYYESLWRAVTQPPLLGVIPPAVSRNLHPKSSEWIDIVRHAIRDLQSHELDKVVVARRSDTRFASAPPISAILQRLSVANAGTTIFALRYDGDTFLGATPERLVTVEGRQVQTMALAGTAPRGLSAEQDAQQISHLLRSSKDLREHAEVVRNITSVLAPHARLGVPDFPQILSLANVHHLWTPIAGTLRHPMSLLTLARLLHPTPAVGGAPKMAAKQWIKNHEGLARGWYAGGVGTFDLHGSGSVWVALRSALIRGNAAYCYAGCGIMADSDPHRELEESEWKLQAMLNALGVNPS